MPEFAGETLNYRIRVGFVTAGEACITTRLISGSRPVALEIRLTARSRGILSALYPIRDRITSRAGADDLRTLTLQRRIREGNRRLHDFWTVDHQLGQAREQHGAQVDVPAGVHDILSALWRLRRDGPAPGVTLQHPLLMGKGVTTMSTVAGQRTENQVPAGRFQCIPLYPTLGDQPAIGPDPTLVVHCSDDTYRWPVKMLLKLPVVGQATIELMSVELEEIDSVEKVVD